MKLFLKKISVINAISKIFPWLHLCINSCCNFYKMQSFNKILSYNANSENAICCILNESKQVSNF
jgi:hypothetical protein